MSFAAELGSGTLIHLPSRYKPRIIRVVIIATVTVKPKRRFNSES